MEQSPTGLGERWQMLRHHGLLIVTAALVTMFGAVLYSLDQKETYTATTRIFVKPVLLQGTVTSQDRFETVVDPLGLSQPIDTQAEVILSDAIADRVARKVPAWMLRGTGVAAQPVTEDVLELRASSLDPRGATRVANAYAAAFIGARRDAVRAATAEAVIDLDRRIAEIKGRIAELESQIASSELSGGDRRIASAELDGLTDSLGTLIVRRGERALDASSISGGGEVIAPAREATGDAATPVRDGAVGLMIGGLLGIGLALLRSNHDRRIYTLDAAADATGVEVIAAIPRPNRLSLDYGGVQVMVDAQRSDDPSATESNGQRQTGLWLPRSSVKAVSALRAELVLRGLGRQYRRVVLLPPEPGDGSDRPAAGLAWACAHKGLRTIVVDGAVGAGAPRPLFGVRSPGLADVLAGKVALPDALVETSTPGLEFLPAGWSLDPVGDALTGKRLRAVMDALSDWAEIVLVRSPVASAGGDASEWATLADAVLLVVRAGVSKPGSAARAARLARSTGAPVLGVVMTDAALNDGTAGVPQRTMHPVRASSGDGKGNADADAVAGPGASEHNGRPETGGTPPNRARPATRRRHR